MAVQTTEEFKNGGATSYTITIEYLQASDIKVRIGGTLQTYTTGTPGSGEYSVSGTTVTLGAAAPSGSGNVHIYRETDVNTAAATFAAGSSIRAADLNAVHDMSRFASVEHRNVIITDDIKDDAVTSAKIADLGIATTNIANDAIDGTKIADDSVDSEHYVDGSIDTQHIANANITTAKLDNNAVTTVKITDANVTTAKLANNSVTTDKIADGAITDVKLAGGALDARYYTKTLLDGGQLDNRYFTETELTNGALDGRYFTEAEADARYFNISTGDTIKDGDTFPDNDTTIATTAAINDRIIDLVDDVGGFVPIANETSFPAANPDVNGGAGTIVSVKAASTNLAPSGTTVTIANGRGTGNPVIITGVSATIPSGFGFLVETTTTAHTYAFHRLVPKATEVSNVASVATEIGRLGTAAAVADMAILGTADVVADMAILGTNDVVADLNTLGTADVVADLNTLGTADVVNDMNILATSANVTAMDTCAANIASINNTSANISSANTFGDQYQVASSPPSTDGGGNALAEGDLYFDTTADELKVYNGGSWQGGVTAAGNFASTTGNTFTGSNTYQDNAKAIFGTGQDLEIHHTGLNSIINDAGTGSLLIQTGGGTKLEVQSSGIGVTGNITVSGNVDGRDLAADGNSLDSIEQGNIGTDVSNGNIKLSPNGTGVVEVRGAGGDDGTLQLNCSAQSHGIKLKSPPHSAAASYTLTFPNSIVNNGFLKTDSSGNLSFAAVNTDLSNDSSPQLGGDLDINNYNMLFADSTNVNNDRLKFGDGNDLQIYHDGTDDVVHSTGTSLRTRSNIFRANNADDTAVLFRAFSGGAFEAYHGGFKKLETTSSGIQSDGLINLTGSGDKMYIADSGKLNFGNLPDFSLQHDGVNNLIESRNANAEVQINFVGSSVENMARFLPNGAVELFHNDNKKFETTSTGVTVTGTVAATSYTGDGSNLTGIAAFPSGTKMLFQQTSAPTGWTKVTSGVHDKALRVVDGTAGSGGTNAFISTFGSVGVTANASDTTATGNLSVDNTTAGGNVSISSVSTSGNVNSHTLSSNEMPSHHHNMRGNQNSNYYHSVNQSGGNHPGSGAGPYINSGRRYTSYNAADNGRTENTGGNGGHSHGFSGSSHNHNGSLSGHAHNHNASFVGSAHNHSISVNNIDLAVQYLDVIIASKD